MPTMPSVILYSKPGCHLCDEAREYLEDAAAEQGIAYDEIDILRDPALFERYRYRIPVIVVAGEERLEGNIEESDVRALFAPRR